MRLSIASALVATAALLPTVLSHNIVLKAHSRECFHEELHKDDKMTVTFQVGDREFGGSGNLDIDFYVCLCYVRADLLPLRQLYITLESHSTRLQKTTTDTRPQQQVRARLENRLLRRLFLRGQT